MLQLQSTVCQLTWILCCVRSLVLRATSQPGTQQGTQQCSPMSPTSWLIAHGVHHHTQQPAEWCFMSNPAIKPSTISITIKIHCFEETNQLGANKIVLQVLFLSLSFKTVCKIFVHVVIPLVRCCNKKDKKEEKSWKKSLKLGNAK